MAPKKRVKVVEPEPGFVVGRTSKPVKPPTPKEIDAMKQRELIRKNKGRVA